MSAVDTHADAPLPRLRDDLKLFDGPAERDGTATWTIYDPVRNRYFRIGRKAFECLSRWGAGTVDALVRAVNGATTLTVSESDVAGLARFLETQVPI